MFEVSVLVALSALLRSVAVASVLIVVVCLRHWDLPFACVLVTYWAGVAVHRCRVRIEDD